MKRSELIDRFFHYIDLESDLDDFNTIHKIIENDLVFKGTNLWILVFAIIIASVGLNMNSTAVIIGAMLISPLMGPINGMGYSIATYNFELFRRSVKNFIFAVVASLAASTTYFAISPISTAHSELLARTSPTIYDVLIALFGGLAGIVAISSRKKGNVIPGVAIATALMPPLCTAGYGLATGQFQYFFGAIYLFTINTVFIAFSSVVISQILKFPIITLIDEARKKKVNRLISLVIVLVLFPSIYFGYNLVRKEKFTENASHYISNIRYVDGNFLLNHEIDPGQRSISLIYAGTMMDEDQKSMIIQKAEDFSLDNARIEFRQGFALDELSLSGSGELNNLRQEIERLNTLVSEKESILDSINSRNYLGREILDEIRIMYPGIRNCSFGNTFFFRDTIPEPGVEELIVFSTKDQRLSTSDRDKIHKWLQTRLKTQDIRVIYQD